MKRSVKSLLLLAAAAAGIVLLLFLSGRWKAAANEGCLVVTVLDGHTQRPVQGCSVVVPESMLQAATDETGRTPVLTVPVRVNTAYDRFLPQTWGEVTVLVYADGYLPYALFHTQVQKGETREDLTVYLFPDDGSMEQEPFSVIEGPDRAWVLALLEKCAPVKTPASPTAQPTQTPAQQPSPSPNP